MQAIALPSALTLSHLGLADFTLSAATVTVAEIGDKTQLLALILAARFRRPWPIAWGMLAATLFNHAIAGAAGGWLSALLGPDTLRWLIGLSFLAMAGWALIPDKLDQEGEETLLSRLSAWGPFVTTLVAFFLAEIGDKTQLATVALAARAESLTAVVIGTTVGMALANLPAIWLGHRFAGRLPLHWIRRGAALLFALIGAMTLIQPW